MLGLALGDHVVVLLGLGLKHALQDRVATLGIDTDLMAIFGILRRFDHAEVY